jgi:hypothetical protein
MNKQVLMMTKGIDCFWLDETSNTSSSEEDYQDDFAFIDDEEDEPKCFQKFIQTLTHDEMFVGVLALGISLYCLFW